MSLVVQKGGKKAEKAQETAHDWPSYLVKGRKACGFSQAVLAEKLGLSISYIGKIERGVLTPSKATGATIKKLLTCSPVDDIKIDDPLDLGDPPTNRDELRALAAQAVHWTLSGRLDPKRADAVTKLCQRAMSLFPEAPREDPHDQMEDPEMYEALQKELRAVEQRLVKAGWFKEPGHSRFRRPKPGLEEYAAEAAENPIDFGDVRGQRLAVVGNGNGKSADADQAAEILRQEFADAAEDVTQDWPEVE